MTPTPGPWLYKNIPGAGVIIKAIIGSTPNPVAFFRVANPQDINFNINDNGELLASIAYEEWVQFPEYASRVVGVDWNKMQASNGRLIAAAPDLLSACRCCIDATTELIDAESPSSTDWINVQAARRIALTAIDKATEEQS